MAMRSPIIERVLSLPLRVNSTARTPYAEASSAVSSNLVNPSERLDEDMSITSPCSAYLPTQPFTTVIQTSVPPPRRSLSHSRTSSSSTIQEPSRTPIRKAKRSHSPPPRYHMVLRPSLASTLNNATPSRPDHYPFASAALRTAYHSVITHLSTTLVPLISVSTGLPHPEFPRSLLQYHLLTHAQLDSLARWYHQTEPATAESWQYPAIIPPFTSAALSMALGDGANSSAFDNVSLETKRRRWGRFIGLRGCESPTEEGEDVLERMERDWWRARERAREEEIAREKGWRGRW
ncbi:uncharacterized protein HMPREF1541_02059 [Cyphellophora europaea CBS 101466]|uniref:Uncharacterized protein n=1 Tax=Cyphellophora europaea (strain CBS 101466) TaxID=1220924 RepID=W2S2I0_CYPE1|nr:uncharacterized protein HMPREF1541_02059 [Cyphellophora europaea CBS 101466]ETN42901.1 hypothetical protein HMPREF1541_02059 [Cyphellophora europaea CBS 101466]